MLQALRLRYVFLAVLAGYGSALLFVSWLQGSFYGGVPATDRNGSNAFPWLVIHVLGPFASGWLAARLCKSQPLLHALFAALVCWLIAAWLGSGLIAGVLYTLAGVGGGLVHAKLGPRPS